MSYLHVLKRFYIEIFQAPGITTNVIWEILYFKETINVIEDFLFKNQDAYLGFITYDKRMRLKFDDIHENEWT